MVATWARVVCLICKPEARGLRVYISGKPHLPMLQLLCTTWLYIGHKPTYVTIIVANIKPTSRTIVYPLGYKHNCEVIYGRLKLPTKAFTKNGRGVLQTTQGKNLDY